MSGSNSANQIVPGVRFGAVVTDLTIVCWLLVKLALAKRRSFALFPVINVELEYLVVADDVK